MNKLRTICLGIILLALSNLAWAAPNIIGTYSNAAARYIAPSLNSCATTGVTIKITLQCGNLIKGTVTVKGVTIPVTGKFFSNNKFIQLDGNTTNISGYQYIVIGAEYQATTKTLKIQDEGFHVSIKTLPDDVTFDVVTLKK